ncbi:MAG: peptidoglycan-binding protein [Gemmatimonadetes bacterium]|nr:peptidoglycan-binding protein [Gemmatimonadota bacterium]
MIPFVRRAGLVLLAFLALSTVRSSILQAQQRLLLPEGTVLTVDTDERLDSGTMREGQDFTTTVQDSVRVDGYTVIPAGSEIVGQVTLVRPADDRESGVLGVEFSTLRLPDGSATAIDGKLTSTDPAERRQIEARGDARVVLVGGRRGVGATIGAIGAGQADDPVSGVLGALGALLSEGSDVEVPAGTTLAVQLERPVVLTARGAPALRPDAFTIYTSEETIRAAQEALRQRGYYRGPADGRLSEATQRALLAFQVDNGVLATGNLDGRTAELLGLSVGVAAALTPGEASFVRRTAQSLVTRWRDYVGIASNGRMDARPYDPAEVELYFAFSGFTDNAGLYEQIVRASGNVDGLGAASGALIEAARRVDAAIEPVRLPARTEDTWNQVRRVLGDLDPEYARE